MAISESHDRAFAMLREGYQKEWKKHTPTREMLSKKEDIAFVRKQKKSLFDQKQALKRRDFEGFYKIIGRK